MRKMMLSIVALAGIAAAGGIAPADAAPITSARDLALIGTVARPADGAIKHVDYDDWRRHEWRRHEEEEWRRREAWRRWHRHEEWRERHYGYDWRR